MPWADGWWPGGAMPIMGLIAVLALAGLVTLAVLLRRAVAGNAEARIRHAALTRVAARRGGAMGARQPAPAGEVDAFLIIPDISGYTQFMQLSHFSLAHAQYAVSALLESVIEAGERSLAIAKVEGDAVLFYALRKAGADGAASRSRRSARPSCGSSRPSTVNGPNCRPATPALARPATMSTGWSSRPWSTAAGC